MSPSTGEWFSVCNQVASNTLPNLCYTLRGHRTRGDLPAPPAGSLPSPSSARSMAMIHVEYTSSSASPFPLPRRPLIRSVPPPLCDACFDNVNAKESDVESSEFSFTALPSILDCSSAAFEDSQLVTSLIPMRLDRLY